MAVDQEDRILKHEQLEKEQKEFDERLAESKALADAGRVIAKMSIPALLNFREQERAVYGIIEGMGDWKVNHPNLSTRDDKWFSGLDVESRSVYFDLRQVGLVLPDSLTLYVGNTPVFLQGESWQDFAHAMDTIGRPVPD